MAVMPKIFLFIRVKAPLVDSLGEPLSHRCICGLTCSDEFEARPLLCLDMAAF